MSVGWFTITAASAGGKERGGRRRRTREEKSGFPFYGFGMDVGIGRREREQRGKGKRHFSPSLPCGHFLHERTERRKRKRERKKIVGEEEVLFLLFFLFSALPGEHSEDEVEHEEGADDDERDEVDPVEVAAHAVVGPVQDLRPALHGDALEDGEHGVADVVEGGDAVVGPLPLLQADGDLGLAGVGAHGGRRLVVRVAGHVLAALSHHQVWIKTKGKE